MPALSTVFDNIIYHISWKFQKADSKESFYTQFVFCLHHFSCKISIASRNAIIETRIVSKDEDLLLNFLNNY